MAHPPFQAPLSQLLGACSVELADLAHRCGVLQTALSPGFSRAAVHDAQAFDLVTQSLAALSQYLELIATDTPGSWTLDPTAAAAALPLASLGDRLVSIESTVDDDGDLCLFEAAS
jgi:hypothetical protein